MTYKTMSIYVSIYPAIECIQGLHGPRLWRCSPVKGLTNVTISDFCNGETSATAVGCWTPKWDWTHDEVAGGLLRCFICNKEAACKYDHIIIDVYIYKYHLNYMGALKYFLNLFYTPNKICVCVYSVHCANIDICINILYLYIYQYIYI